MLENDDLESNTFTVTRFCIILLALKSIHFNPDTLTVDYRITQLKNKGSIYLLIASKISNKKFCFKME